MYLNQTHKSLDYFSNRYLYNTRCEYIEKQKFDGQLNLEMVSTRGSQYSIVY